MAIDKRQIADINFTLPNFGLQLIVDDNVTDISQELSNINDVTIAKFTIPKSIFVGVSTDTQQGEGGSGSGIAPLDDPQDLAFYDPYTIVQQVRAGRASEYWNVGDKIKVKMNEFSLVNTQSRPIYEAGLYELMVIGFDHNLEYETPDYEHTMTFMFTGNPTYFPNILGYSLNSSIEGFIDIEYALVSVFTHFADRIYNALPEEWSDIIIPTTKTGVFNLAKDSPKIFLLSNYEANGDYYCTSFIKQEDLLGQKQYSYFKQNSTAILKKAYTHVGPHFETDSTELTNYCLKAAIASRTLYNGKVNSCLWLNAAEGATYQLLPKGKTRQLVQYNNIAYRQATTISDIYSSTNNINCIAGIIPCFTIG